MFRLSNNKTVSNISLTGTMFAQIFDLEISNDGKIRETRYFIIRELYYLCEKIRSRSLI